MTLTDAERHSRRDSESRPPLLVYFKTIQPGNTETLDVSEARALYIKANANVALGIALGMSGQEAIFTTGGSIGTLFLTFAPTRRISIRNTTGVAQPCNIVVSDDPGFTVFVA